MSSFMAIYPLTPRLYEEMMRLGETKVGVIRYILCQHYGIEMKCTFIANIDKTIEEKLITEVTLLGKPRHIVVNDIIEAYFANRPKFPTRPPEEVDREIEARIWETRNPLYNPNRKAGLTKKIRNGILAKRLHVRDSYRLDSEISRITELTGKTREEIERDLLCMHFGIKQVVE